jgi:HPt (histidine-containing phosphotransfer) domain-containing protein
MRPIKGKGQMGTPSSDVDLSRFRELSDDDPKGFRELAELYLTKTAEQVEELRAAIKALSYAQASRIAHSLVGANLMVGMNSVVPVLRALEQQAEQGNAQEVHAQFAEAERRFKVIQNVLKEALSQPS